MALVALVILAGCAHVATSKPDPSSPEPSIPAASPMISPPAPPTTSSGPPLPSEQTAGRPATDVVNDADTTPIPPEQPAPTPAQPTEAAAPPASTAVPPYRFPIEDIETADYAREHHDYPAADIFARCGAGVVAPTDATVLEVRRDDQWDRTVDNPATRGGRSVTILGVDDVRYYFAHLETITAGLEPGQLLAIGTTIGTVGATGRASACHLHFAISPTCPGKEWSIRRGVIEPWDYLDAWRQGEPLTPTDAVRTWQDTHPDACAIAIADPNAAQS